jgi:hypothetical protein
MDLQLTENQIFANRCPAQIIAVEWLDNNNQLLATSVAKHNVRFQKYESDREYSGFLEQVSNLENDVLYEIEKIYPDIFQEVRISGRLLITDQNSEIIYYQN